MNYLVKVQEKKAQALLFFCKNFTNNLQNTKFIQKSIYRILNDMLLCIYSLRNTFTKL